MELATLPLPSAVAANMWTLADTSPSWPVKWICFFIYTLGPGGSSGKAFGYGLDGPGSIPGVGGVEIFLHSFVSLPHPSTTVAVNMWALVSTPPVGLHGL